MNQKEKGKLEQGNLLKSIKDCSKTERSEKKKRNR